jgi:hypothetical protein
LPCCCAVGTYKDLHAAIRERDLAVLAVHGRKERNPAAPNTLLPASNYSKQEVAAAAAELLQRVRGSGSVCLDPHACSYRLCMAQAVLMQHVVILGGTQLHPNLRAACRVGVLVEHMLMIVS